MTKMTTTTTTTIYDNNILSNTYPVSDLVHYRSQAIGRNTGIKDNHGEAPQAHSSTDEQKVSLFFCEVKAGRGYPSVEQPLAQAIFFFFFEEWRTLACLLAKSLGAAKAAVVLAVTTNGMSTNFKVKMRNTLGQVVLICTL